jgi:exodeoxyribonuclease V alpha subunit
VLLPAPVMDESVIDDLIGVYLPGTSPPVTLQKRAVKSAVINHFTIISGGPGTGKTFVTGCIKGLLFAMAQRFKQPEPRILCVAPTGKAASKMDQGKTIHSVLRPLTSGPGFFHNKKNPLTIDVIIIDEASMIDMLLLTRLLEAVPLQARVILLGDNHQLTSIQAGSVFYDICSVKGLSNHLFFLEYNFRSKGKTGIEALSHAINSNDADGLESLLTRGDFPDIEFENFEGQDTLAPALEKIILKGYTPFVRADTIEAALNELDTFKILCAHNSGEYGTLQINHVCENILRSVHNFDIQDGFFKRIIMVRSNDYKRELFNGDTGIVFEKKEGVNTFFITRDKAIKHYRESDLPGVDTAFAITIHKSQGSEYKTVLIVVPDKLSPVVTRQLLYTGVTRARSKVIVLGRMRIIKKAIQVCVKRNSGIGPCLETKLLTKSLE